ncbi:hypothetical protein [Streptomyces sp. H27-D2]|uniref:hypothetical protein n=1 Tax=Streptomyces sp. H27-D2 TaxID=3046304 RepID=UPI002DBDE388|nr:hypothetical protein [Streptomyces sp. H27-D2]MEC4016033.1 hypothetical protein [Streptomyces sp. H27-D2]
MSPLERLMAESVPDGTFGGSRPVQRPPRAATAELRGPDPRAAEHVAVLEAALNRREGRGTGRPERHLRAVPPTENAA